MSDRRNSSSDTVLIPSMSASYGLLSRSTTYLVYTSSTHL